ncbi:MAG: RNA polymerase sigma-70 factor [Bacteroides sp.]
MDLNEISEKTITALRHGDVKSFDKIYHTYYLYLCAIAVYYVRNRQVAAEIVNDVFVSFWQKRNQITYPVLPYLRRAIQNGSISYLRSSSYAERELIEEDALAFLENHILSSDNPLESLEASEMHEMILQKVNELPDRCRAIFKSHLYESKSYTEIAEEYGLSVTTVRVQMKIALEKLKDKLPGSHFIALLIFFL